MFDDVCRREAASVRACQSIGIPNRHSVKYILVRALINEEENSALGGVAAKRRACLPLSKPDHKQMTIS